MESVAAARERDPTGLDLHVGDEADQDRALAVAAGSAVAILAVLVSRWAAEPGRGMVPYGEATWHSWTLTLLSTALALSLYAADGGQMLSSGWHRLGRAFGNKEGSPPVVPWLLPRGSTSRFLVLLASVVVLAAGLMVLVMDSGGVNRSPFLQLLLVYFICGVLVADERRTQVVILGLSVAVPVALWLSGEHLFTPTEIEANYGPGDVAVLSATSTLIAGVVNMMTRSQ